MDYRKAHGLSICMVLILSFGGFVGFGQGYENDEVSTEKTVDRTYALYLQKDWKALIANGDSVLKDNSDYYYLRLRLGIAHYELAEYFLAEEQFKQAIVLNTLENLPKEYLYYCYFWTGQIEQSRRLAKKFNNDLTTKISLDTVKFINYIGLDGGGKFSDLIDVPNAALVGVNLGHRLKSDVFIDHAYSFYSQNNDLWNFKQHNYFLQASVPLKDNFTVRGSGHYVNSNYLFTAVNTSEPLITNWFVSSVMIEKQGKKQKADFGVTTMASSDYFQLQYNLGYTYYPKANTDLFLGLKAYLHTSDAHATTNFAAMPYVSYRPYNKWNIFASYLLNQGNNIAEWNGTFVNNSPDLTTGRFSTTLTYQTTKQTSLSLIYQYELKESDWTSNHTYNSLFVSLKYRPL